MVQVFVTRVHGFDPSRWPAISFGKPGNRTRLQRQSRLGDVIAFVATHSDEVEPEDQGRLLGLAEIGRKPIDTLELIDRRHLQPKDWNPDGSFRWPKSLTMNRAWRHAGDPPPDIRHVLGRQLSYGATHSALLLDAEEAALIWNQPWEEVVVRDSQAMRGQQQIARRAGPTTGPPPASGSYQARREEVDARVYVMRFGKRDVWKIGYARDPAARRDQINRDVPYEVLDEAWSVAYTTRPMTQDEAYALEQDLLRRLSGVRTEGERVVCSEIFLRSIWCAALGINVE
jgi:hypothetical protein